MREYLVSRDERGQRLDKYLRRRLPAAPSSFIYKMLRKKNITLRGKKADGSEKVEEGDLVVLFLSDETIEKFSGSPAGSEPQRGAAEEERAFRELQPLLGKNPVLYEDEDVLIVTKPAGVLSQKSAPGDISMNEWLRGYLNHKKTGTCETAASGFRPSVCNRLDRNTGGILLCAKSLQGSRALSGAIRDRKIRKTYKMVVHGKLTAPGVIEGDLIKDRQQNQVRIAEQTDREAPASRAEAAQAPGRGTTVPSKEGPATAAFGEADPEKKSSGKAVPGVTDAGMKSSGKAAFGEADPEKKCSGKAVPRAAGSDDVRRHAVTVYRPLFSGKRATMVEADLITGRSHQLRVHMASIGHPILFDPRYGNRELDKALKRRIRGQLLWCSEIEFPSEDPAQDENGDRHDVLKRLRGRVFTSPEPAWWKDLCENHV